MSNNSVLLKKFMVNKRSVNLEDCMMLVEQFHPEDKSWFYHLCVDEVEQTDKNGKTYTGVRQWGAVKSEVYKRYFPGSAELSRRMKMFSSWNIED